MNFELCLQGVVEKKFDNDFQLNRLSKIIGFSSSLLISNRGIEISKSRGHAILCFIYLILILSSYSS